MSVQALSWAMKLQIKPASAKSTLICLADFTTDTGKSYPSMNTMKRETSLTEAQVEYGLQVLIDLKVITDTGIRVGDAKEIRVFQLMPIKDLPKLTGRRKPTNPDLIKAEEIFKIYPRPVAKPQSLAKISKAIKESGFDFVKERTILFAAAWKGRLDIEHCAHSGTWFGQQRYLDDPATWGLSPQKISIVKLSEVQQFVNEHIQPMRDEKGWASSFYNYWAKRKWMKNDKLIDWKDTLSKQLVLWRQGIAQ